MSPASTFARIVTHHRLALHAGVVLLVVAAVAVIALRLRFASDVLDLLPQHFQAVQAFKTFDREFSQARQLTIGLLDESGQCDLDGFTAHLGEELRKEPWVLRVLDQPPTEGAGAWDDVRTLALPMLLNLDDAEFDTAMQALAPVQVSIRIGKLHAGLVAGSPLAEAQMEHDPLGIIQPVVARLGSSFSMEQTRPLVSPDGTLHLVFARTNQPDLGARACRETMRQWDDFQKRAVASWAGPGPVPKILVTGRTPYVSELSGTMGGDVISTVAGSVILVSVVFFLGFRRWRPLLAIMQVLALCCLVAVALGTLVFRELNIITVGLCSILIGLGVDFGMMLYAVYEREREGGAGHEAAIAAAIRSQGRGVLFGALTSGAGFLCFLRSQSTGFEQLGVLIAFGVLCAGLFMATVFFAFVGERFRPRAHDWLWSAGERFVGFVDRAPRRYALLTALLLGAATVVAIAPVGRLQFDANPKSLEPQGSRAGTAMRTIQSRMPIAAEPVILLLHSRGPEDFHTGWTTLQNALTELVAAKHIRSAVTPAALAISPAQIARNTEKLRKIDLAAGRAALSAAMTQADASPDTLKGAFALFDALQTVARGDASPLDWRKALPPQSSWWFILDHFFSRDPNLAAAYVTPLATLTTLAEKEQLRADLEATKVPVQISGWSYTLQDLGPWAKGKLTELSGFMILFNIVLLIFLYRRWFPLFILMVSLALSIGALVTSLKLFGIPLNMFNVLAFPLVLGVGVDYGIYVAVAVRQEGDRRRNLATVVKPVLLSGLTTTCGFGSLGLADNPALKGLGVVCALGVAWCLLATLCFVLPAYVWRESRHRASLA